MRDELAERLLARVMEWEPDQVARYGAELQMLAALKYDGYDGYRPGVKFLETLAEWLSQFPLDARKHAIQFVLEDLVFISQAELDHVIEIAYSDVVRPMLIRMAAERLGISRFAANHVASSDEFKALQRKMLVLGLSDGARLDQLRRASPGLSHEQFYLQFEIAEETIQGMKDKLQEAISDTEAVFDHVLLVDDFSGSGFTLLRQKDAGWEGKLWRASERMRRLAELGALEETAAASVLVYIASEQAARYVREKLNECGLRWQVYVIQELPAALKVTDEELMKLCEWHFDDVLVDVHKRGRIPLGFGEAALPLVLHHNTPNNSICLLWADTSDHSDGLNRRALFPRYERHSALRP